MKEWLFDQKLDAIVGAIRDSDGYLIVDHVGPPIAAAVVEAHNREWRDSLAAPATGRLWRVDRELRASEYSGGGGDGWDTVGYFWGDKAAVQALGAELLPEYQSTSPRTDSMLDLAWRVEAVEPRLVNWEVVHEAKDRRIQLYEARIRIEQATEALHRTLEAFAAIGGVQLEP